jgi:hypothetical protein
LSCGWSQDGLQTFNKLATEISKDRKENGEEFNKAFKISMEQEMQSSDTNKNAKRKQHCIDTYNDLNGNGLMINNEEESDDSDKDEWVMKNAFQV